MGQYQFCCMYHGISGILANTTKKKRVAKRNRMIKLVRTTRWQYCLKYKAYSTKTIVLWPFIADSMHTTCLQLQCKMAIFKEDNHKLVVSSGFVLILLLTSTVEQVLVQYHGSNSSGTMLLDFNTKPVRDDKNILQSVNVLRTRFLFHVLSFWRREIWGH